jgi:hypothetical protein
MLKIIGVGEITKVKTKQKRSSSIVDHLQEENYVGIINIIKPALKTT